jgi:hypothetical protein
MMKFNDRFKIKDDIPPREFIRKYGLMMFNINHLKFALLLSCGDDPDQAARIVGLTESQLIPALRTLIRLGYLAEVVADG